MLETDSKWASPQDVSDVQLAFPAQVSSLMPPHDEALRDWQRTPDARKWIKVQQDWFFYGMKDTNWSPKDGIDTKRALRHLAAVQGSFEPKHEHKEAAVAYLMWRWFDDVTYSKANG